MRQEAGGTKHVARGLRLRGDGESLNALCPLIDSAGFTLLEMSIVLAIIGTIIGAVLVSWSMIVSARLQTVITDVDSYTGMVANFQQQYQALPGDFAGATAIWGTDSSGCNTGGGPTGTCNGNGDGEIGSVSGQEFETFRFWQQLYDAGMFSQSLSGVHGSAGVYAAAAGANVPAGSMVGSAFSVIWWGTVATGDSYRYSGNYDNAFQFGATVAGCGASSTLHNCTYGPVLTPDQASSIDTKIDDGAPATGKVRAFNSTSYSCTATSGSLYLYNVTATSLACAPIFVMGF